jgi:hypothetical protein
MKADLIELHRIIPSLRINEFGLYADQSQPILAKRKQTSVQGESPVTNVSSHFGSI